MSPEEIGTQVVAGRSLSDVCRIKRETLTIKDRVKRINSRTRVDAIDNRFLEKKDAYVCVYTSSDQVRQSLTSTICLKNLNCLRRS